MSNSKPGIRSGTKWVRHGNRLQFLDAVITTPDPLGDSRLGCLPGQKQMTEEVETRTRCLCSPVWVFIQVMLGSGSSPFFCFVVLSTTEEGRISTEEKTNSAKAEFHSHGFEEAHRIGKYGGGRQKTKLAGSPGVLTSIRSKSLDFFLLQKST